MFLLRPDEACRDLFGYWLARGLEHFPGVKLVAVAQMSNHLHLCLRDEASELSELGKYVFGNLAKDLNELRERSGPLWERRFAAEPILDTDALVERVAYIATNPVAAGLVERHEEWPGVVGFAGAGEPTELSFPRTRPWLDDDAPAEVLTLRLASLPELDPDQVRAAVVEREKALGEARRGSCLGAELVKATEPTDQPAKPKRSPRPLCHTTCGEAYKAFREAWRALRRAFAEASARWRGGDFQVEFPPYTFRPHVFVGPLG